MSNGDSLSQVESTIKGGVNNLTALLNVPASPTAAIGFVAEGIFKAIRLGRDIKAAQDKANAALEDKIRAQSILRTPIVVDLSPLELRTFYKDPITRMAFPALKQFQKELDEFDQSGGNPSAETLEVLKAAKALVPILKGDPTLKQHPDLKQLFTIGLNPDQSNVRELVLEYMRLFPDGELPYSDHYSRMESFWKDKLQLELQGLQQAQIDAQQALDQAVSGLVKSAILDPQQGLAAQALGLAKKLKLNAIDAEIAKLQAANPSDPKIQALQDWKTRINAL